MPVRCVKCDTDNTDTAKFCSECAAPLQPIEDIGVTKTIETPIEKLSTGTVLADRYEIIEELGKGGMGRVYKVHDKEVKEKVALKLLNPEIASDEDTIERFRNELKIARKVSHKHICRMHDLGRADGKYFITMEYVEGEDLKSHIRKKERLSTRDALALAKQICEGLAEAHRLGVVHRDLKPQNIMIDKQGDAKIMDFGIARSREAPGVTATGVIIGTPDYISPEQADGVEADQRSDIYSLGVILYEMVTGTVPFKGDTAFSVALKHKSQLPLHPQKLNPDASDDLSRLILICMEKDRDRRYQTAEELLADLKNIEEGFPLGTKVQPRKATFASSITKNKLFVPALVIVIALIAVLIWKFLPRGEIAVAPKIENSIAVIHFENLTGDPGHDDLIKFLPSLFITEFEGMGFSRVTTLERLQDILKQMGKDPEKPIGTETGFEACRREGVEAMAVGRITKAGNVFAINLQILDVETKNSLASDSAQGEGIDSILSSQIDELAVSIAEKLDWDAVEKAAVPSIAEYTTSSMEAYQYYMKGNEAFEKLDFDGARDYYLKAVDIDPSFAMAHLGVAHTHFQQVNNAGAQEAMLNAVANIEKANPKEKLYIHAYYARYVENDQEKRMQILEEIAQKYPMEKEVHYFLGRYYETKRNYEEAIKKYQMILEMDPFYSLAHASMIAIARAQDDYENATRWAARYVSACPNEPNPYLKLGQVNFDKAQLDQAIEQFQKALEVKPDFRDALHYVGLMYAYKEEYLEAIKWAAEDIDRSTAPTDKADAYLMKAFYEYWVGAFRLAIADTETARSENEGTQNLVVPFYAYVLKGFAYRSLQNYEKSRDCFIQAEKVRTKRNPASAPVFESNREYFLGSIDIEEGNLDAAKKRLATIAQLLSENEDAGQKKQIDIQQKYLLAELLIAEGSIDEAISILELIPSDEKIVIGAGHHNMWSDLPMQWDLYQPWIILAYAYEQNGETDKAIDILEEHTVLTPPSRLWPIIPPKIYYDLGRLYEKKGMRQKARENYMRFLDLWKDADPGLPEPHYARQQLEQLNK